MNPFLQLMHRNEAGLGEDLPLPRRLQQHGRNPDDVLRSALEKHAKYKSFVALGNSKPTYNSNTCGMARLQFGDGEYAQDVQDMQRLAITSSYRQEPLPEIEEPIPITRTLLRTPGALSLSQTRSSFTGGAISGLPTASSTIALSTAALSSRGSAVFKETGSLLAAVLAATDGSQGHGSVGGADTASSSNNNDNKDQVSHRDTAAVAAAAAPPLPPADAASVSTAGGAAAAFVRDATASPRIASRRSLASLAAGSAAGSATASPGVTTAGEAESDAPTSGSPHLRMLVVPQRRLSLNPSEQHSPVSGSPVVGSPLQGAPAVRFRRESGGAERVPMHTRPLHQMLLHRGSVNGSSGGGSSSKTQSQSGFTAVEPSPTPLGGIAPAALTEYLRGGGGAVASTRDPPPHLVPYQSAPAGPASRVQFAPTVVQNDMPRPTRASLMAAYGNQHHHPGLPLRAGSEHIWDGGAPAPAPPPGPAPPPPLSFDRMSSRGRGAAVGMSGSETGDQLEYGYGSPDGSTPRESDDVTAEVLATTASAATRSMNAAEMAILSEATRRYSMGRNERSHVPHPQPLAAAHNHGMQQQLHHHHQHQHGGGDGSPGSPFLSPQRSNTLLRRTSWALGADGSGVGGSGGSATERADGLLRELRSPDPRELRSPDPRVSGSGRPTMSDGQLQPRPPASSPGKASGASAPAPAGGGGGGSGGFHRSYSLRSKRSGQWGGDTAPAATTSSSFRGSRPSISVPVLEESSRSASPTPGAMPGLPSSAPAPVTLRVASGSGVAPAAPHDSPARDAAATTGAAGVGATDGADSRQQHLAPGGGGGGGGGGEMSPALFAKAGFGALQGWSSKKSLSLGERMRRSTTDAVFGRSSSSRDEGESPGSPHVALPPQRGAAAAAAAAVVIPGRTSHPGPAPGAGRVLPAGGDVDSGSDSDDDDDDDRTAAAAEEEPGGQQGLQAMLAKGLKGDIRALLKGGAKFMVLKKFKQAQAIAAVSKVKEKGWKK